MKRIAILLLLALLLLSGCTKSATYSAAGDYITTAIAAGDIVYDPDGSTLRLFADGTCTSTLRGEEETGTWSEKGTDLAITLNGTCYLGTLQGDTLSLHCVFDFTLHRGTLPLTTKEPQATAEPDPVTEEEPSFSFAGSWYGYWVITEASGDYADSEGQWWDLCAEISLNADNSGTMLLWDEDYARDNVLGALDVTLGSDALLVQSGFFGVDELSEGEWMLLKDSLGYENLMTAEGSYEDENGSYAYMLYLRPWGQVWDDVAESDLPRAYTKWYLPLIEKEKEMPDAVWKTK